MTAAETALLVLAFSVMLQYFVLGLYLIPRLFRLQLSKLPVLISVVGASLFFVGCAFTHIELWAHTSQVLSGQHVNHHILNHIPQVLGGWMFIIAAWKYLDMQLALKGDLPDQLIQALDVTPVAIYIKRRDGKYIYCNRTTEDRLRLTSLQDLTDHEAALSTDLRKHINEFDQEVWEAGSGSREETVNEVTWYITKSRLDNDHLVGCAVDITEARRLEKELGYTRRMEAVGQLSSGAAHDFNHTLGILKNYVKLVERDLPDPIPGRVQDDLKVIREAIGQGERLAKQLAGLGRQRKSDKRRVCFNDVLEQLRPLLKFETDSIRVEYQLGMPCPNVCIDPAQLEQIVFNLAINARDAMTDSNGRGASIVYRSRCDDQWAYLDVIDNGTGFSEQALERAFEPFFTTKPRAQGTGLGLSTVYGLVKSAGGRVDISNNPDGGATVTVSLPLAD